MRLPPVKAFGAALAYLATHALELLKAIWLPTLLLTAVGIYTLPAFMGAMLEIMALGPEPDPNRLMELAAPVGKPMVILFAASLVLYPMIYVAAMRHILLGQQLRLPFYLQFGGAELRVFATFVLLMIVLVLVDIVGNLGVAGLSLAGRAASPQIGESIESLLTLAFTLFTLWLQIRLSLSLPAAIAERRIGLPVSWYKTKGNSLRLLLYYILFGLIVLPVLGVVAALNWSAVSELIASAAAAGDDPQKSLAAVTDFIRAYVDRLKPGHPGFALSAGLYYLYSLFGIVIGTVPTAIAYRYIVGEPAKAR